MHDYPKQFHAYQELVRVFDNREPAIFFVDGPGGSGKSFILRACLHYVRGRGEIAAACAWSGLAYTRFGFPKPLPREDVPWSVTADGPRAGADTVLRGRLGRGWHGFCCCP